MSNTCLEILPQLLELCNWRLDISGLGCQQHEAGYVTTEIIAIVSSFTLSVASVAVLLYRRKRYPFLNKDGMMNPIELMCIFQIVFCTWRGVNASLILGNVLNNHFAVGEFVFEFPWSFGFGTIAFYAATIIIALVNFPDFLLFQRLRHPWRLYWITIGYLLFIFITQNVLAIVAGVFGDRMNAYLSTLMALFEESPTSDPSHPTPEELDVCVSLSTEFSLYSDLVLVRYALWTFHSILLLSCLLVFVCIFLFVTRRNARILKPLGTDADAMRVFYTRLKVTTLGMSITLGLFAVINILAPTQRYWNPHDRVATLVFCILWNVMPALLYLVVLIAFVVGEFVKRKSLDKAHTQEISSLAEEHLKDEDWFQLLEKLNEPTPFEQTPSSS